MLEPTTVSTLGAVALTEGIKFLYSQAGEILKRWRNRQNTINEAPVQLNQTEIVQVNLPPTIFEEQISTLNIHFDRVQQLEQELHNLRKDLFEYADGTVKVDEKDENLLLTIDVLRQLLETIYQQPLTFKEKQRSSSDSVVKVEMNAEKVLGDLEAIEKAKVNSGEVYVQVDVGTAHPEAKVTGIKDLELG